MFKSLTIFSLCADLFSLLVSDEMANFASKRNKRQIGMSKIFVICMATLMLAACAVNGSRKTERDALAEAGEGKSGVVQGNDSLAMCQWVERVYADVFSAYLKNLQGQAPEPDAIMFDRKYFSAAFLRLDSLIREANVEGYRDADHWIQGQDWCEDLACRIDSTDQVHTVYITITNCQHEQPVALLLEKSAEQSWKIADMSVMIEKEWVSELTLMKFFSVRK